MAFDQRDSIRQPEATLTDGTNSGAFEIDWRDVRSLQVDKQYTGAGGNRINPIQQGQLDFGSTDSLNDLYGEGVGKDIAGRYVPSQPEHKTLIYKPDTNGVNGGGAADSHQVSGKYVHQHDESNTSDEHNSVNGHTEHKLLIYRPDAAVRDAEGRHDIDSRDTGRAHQAGDRSTDASGNPGDLAHEGAEGADDDLKGRYAGLLEKFGEIMKEFQETMKEYLDLLEDLLKGKGGGGAGGGGAGGAGGGAGGGGAGGGGAGGGAGGDGGGAGGGDGGGAGGGDGGGAGGGDGAGGAGGGAGGAGGGAGGGGDGGAGGGDGGGAGGDGMPGGDGFPKWPPEPEKTSPDLVWVKPPAPYGQGQPFPDRGKSSGYDVPISGRSDAIREMEENGKAPPDAAGLKVKVTEPAPEIWRRIDTADGKTVYISMQQGIDTNPFDGKTPYEMGANGKLTVKENVSFDPIAMYSMVVSPTNPGGRIPPAGDLYYRGTDGNLHELQGKIVHRPGKYHGNDSDGWYELEYNVPKDMAFVRQQWVEGSGFPKIAEKFLIDGKVMTLFEASKVLGK